MSNPLGRLWNALVRDRKRIERREAKEVGSTMDQAEKAFRKERGDSNVYRGKDSIVWYDDDGEQHVETPGR